jgi:hypothetical protein
LDHVLSLHHLFESLLAHEKHVEIPASLEERPRGSQIVERSVNPKPGISPDGFAYASHAAFSRRGKTGILPASVANGNTTRISAAPNHPDRFMFPRRDQPALLKNPALKSEASSTSKAILDPCIRAP